MDWELYFKSIILERGYDYYQMNAVEILNASKNAVEANVMGRASYDVRISLRDDNITFMYCSCPYEDNCKHLAAVLYYMDNHPEIFSKDNNIRDLVYNVSLNDLQNFLIEEFENDSALLNRFRIFADLDIDENFYIEKLKNSFSKPVNVIRFTEEDIPFLIKSNHFDLVLKLSKLMVDYLEEIYNYDYDAFYIILHKLDTIMIDLFNKGYEKPVLDFLADIILNSDNIEILDMLTDTYSRIGDVEKLFEDNLKS